MVGTELLTMFASSISWMESESGKIFDSQGPTVEMTRSHVMFLGADCYNDMYIILWTDSSL